jgi:exopolysaccharide biosynthesis polyprenyl glycosylphosphotransferase
MRRRFLVSTAVADVGALLFGMAVASTLVFGTAIPWLADLEGGQSIWALLGFFLASAVVASALSAQMWAGSAPRPSYGRGLAIVLTAVAATALLVVLTRVYWSRSFLVWTTVFWVIGAFAHRALRRRRPWTERMVVASHEKELLEHLRDAPHVEVVSVLDPATEGDIEPLPSDVTLVIDLRSVLSDRMAQFATSSTLAGITIRAFTNVYEEHTGRLPVVHLAEGWELRTPASRTAPYQAIKRFLDVSGVLITSPLTIGIGLAVAIAVRMSSPGPVIFKQTRAGRAGVPFTLYKFRTMRADAEQNGPMFAMPDDDRLTAVGRFMRRSRVDELPQLWNVLKGDLSIVGPRPEQMPFVEKFEEEIPFYSQRHLIRPGVTGWAQVRYGYADDQADTMEKLTYDLYYVKNMSPWLDLHVLGESIWTVLSGNGAR